MDGARGGQPGEHGVLDHDDVAHGGTVDAPGQDVAEEHGVAAAAVLGRGLAAPEVQDRDLAVVVLELPGGQRSLRDTWQFNP